MIEEEMRAVIAAHAEECGARAEQMMVNNHLYPDEIAAWAAEVERLRAVEAATTRLAAMIEILGPDASERAYLTGDREKINAATRALWAALAVKAR